MHTIDRRARKVHGFAWHEFWLEQLLAEVFTTPAQYLGCKDWDCTVLRTAMGVDPAEGYIQNPEGFKVLIMKVIDAANKQGIYVITDFHYHNIHLNKVKTFFTEIAKNYASNPT